MKLPERLLRAIAPVLLLCLVTSCSDKKSEPSDTDPDRIESPTTDVIGPISLEPFAGEKAELHELLEIELGDDGSHDLQNPMARVRATFDRGAVTFEATRTPAPKPMSIGFSSIGREFEGERARLDFDAGEAKGNVLRRSAADAEEYFVNRARGVEHGLVVSKAPTGEGRVMVDVAVGGGYRALSRDDFNAVFEHPNAPTLAYSNLAVFDAKGRELPARMWPHEIDGNRGLRIAFDDTDAVYPVVVDPILGSLTDRIWPAATEKAIASCSLTDTYCGFGQSVALYDDVLVVGRPYEGSGAFEVYVRDEGGAGRWGLKRRVPASGSTTWNNFGYSVAMARVGAETIIVVGDPTAAADGAVEVYEIATADLVSDSTVSFDTDNFTSAFSGDVDPGTMLGASVATNGTYIAVGAPATNEGQLLLAERVGPTNIVRQGAYQIPGNVGVNDELGASVAMDSTLVVAGAPESSQILVVDLTTSPAFQFLPDDDDDGSSARSNVRLGASVDVQNNLVVAGAPMTSGTGEVVSWTYTPDAGNAIGTMSLATRTPVAAANDRGGWTVATNGTDIWAGAPEGPGAADEGAFHNVGGAALSLPPTDRTTVVGSVGEGAHVGVSLARDKSNPTGNIFAVGAPGFAFDREFDDAQSLYANGAVLIAEDTTLRRIVRRQADSDVADFGTRLDLTNDLMVVMSESANSANDTSYSEVVYLYERKAPTDPAGEDLWTLVEAIEPAANYDSGSTNVGGFFPLNGWGSEVATNGEYIAVEALWGAGPIRGIFLFRWDQGLDTLEVADFQRLDMTNDYSNGEVDMDFEGDFLAVGLPAHNRTYVFDVTGGTLAPVTGAPLTGSGRFGNSVSIRPTSPARLAIGAPDASADGEVQVYDLADLTGAPKTLPGVVTSAALSLSGGGDEFGTAVAFKGQTLAVGAPNAPNGGMLALLRYNSLTDTYAATKEIFRNDTAEFETLAGTGTNFAQRVDVSEDGLSIAASDFSNDAVAVVRQQALTYKSAEWTSGIAGVDSGMPTDLQFDNDSTVAKRVAAGSPNAQFRVGPSTTWATGSVVFFSADAAIVSDVCDGLDNDNDGSVDEDAVCGGLCMGMAGCPTSCSSDTDCTPGGICRDNGTGTLYCRPDTSIVCATLTETKIDGVCLTNCDPENPTTCGPDTCYAEPTSPDGGVCSTPGGACMGNAFACGPDSAGDPEVCFDGGCFQECMTDGDCTDVANSKCDTVAGRCVPPDSIACDDINCPSGSTCYDGQCYNDCDDNSDCTGGETCYINGLGEGRCADTADPCGDVFCPPDDMGNDQFCHEGACYPTCADDDDCTPPNICYDAGAEQFCNLPDPCDGVFCPFGDVCFEGSCFATCGGGCGADICYENDGPNRCAPDACDGVLCPFGEVCMNGVCGASCGADSDCPDSHKCEGPCDTPTAGSNCDATVPGRCLPSDCDRVNCGPGFTCSSGICGTDCMSDATCNSGEVCYDGACVADPCSSNPCTGGEVCYGGGCYPGCASAADCSGGQVCEDGRCTEGACSGIDCPIGQVCYDGSCYDPCDNDGDCSPPNLCFNNVCAADPCEGVSCPFGEECYGGSCAPPCGSMTDCANNSDCSGGETCENINSTSGRGYCIECGADECFALGCRSNADCPSSYNCVKEAASDAGACLPAGCDPTTTSCSSPGLTCRATPCDGVQCPIGQVCYDGSCYDPCTNNGDCTPPNSCFDGVCTNDLCRGTQCPIGQVCYAGSCYEPCDDNGDCSPPDLCYDGRCAADPCDQVACPFGEICVDGGCFEGCSANTDCSEFIGTGDFVQVASAYGLALPSDKDGGFTWNDFNRDGCLDVVVNGTSWVDSRYMFSDCNLPDPAFSDETPWLADHLMDQEARRSAVSGDLNNDTYPDLIRTGGSIYLYLNEGPMYYDIGVGVPDNPNQQWGGNPEGAGIFDYDGDQDLDFFVQDDDAIALFTNDGSGNFSRSYPSSLESDESGDYCATADFDVDGDVDILCRFEEKNEGDGDGRDMFRNNGGSFTAVDLVDEDGTNSRKSGVVFCDYDNDGDFDLFWGGSGTNQFWEQPSSGPWIETGKPLPGSGFDLNQGNQRVNGVDCGDVDNDGDLDLFVTRRNRHKLFINQLVESGSADFVANPRGIDTEDASQGTMVDYDNDGDLDIYINADDGNELWRNPLTGGNYIMVRPRVDLGGGDYRDALGATITVYDPDGNVLGVREANGGSGRGSQQPTPVHFGLQNGDNVPYRFVVQFPHSPVEVVERCVVPNTLSGYRILRISNTDSNDTSACANPNWRDDIVATSSGEFCFDDHCAGTACEGITCDASKTCVGGTCVDTCTLDTDCPDYPTDICYLGRCADAADPACDGVKCPADQQCYQGECFRTCSSGSDCGGDEICYQGECRQVSCSKIGGKCDPGFSCHQGVCFQDCMNNGDCTTSGESCIDGRCATDTCAALTVDYQANHIFTETGRKLTADQYSRAYIWPRPAIGSNDMATFASYSAGSSTTPNIHRESTARVAVYLDPTLSDGDNPEGRYVLWLTHGRSTAAQGAARANYQVRLNHNGNAALDTQFLDDPDEMFRRMSDGNQEIVVTQITSEANTTGGVALGPLPARIEDWTITVDATFSGDIDRWEIFNPEDNSAEPLKMGEQLTLRSVGMSPDVVLAPEVGLRCDAPGAFPPNGICNRGTFACSALNLGYPNCDQTVFAHNFEICDGEDNNCDGTVDEASLIRVPYVQYNQNDGWKYWTPADSSGDFFSTLNFTARGADDRLGSTDYVGVEGMNWQETEKSFAIQHRNLQTGELTLGFLHGADAPGGSDREVRMSLDFPGNGTPGTETFRDAWIAYVDDGRPAADEAPDTLDAGDWEIDMRWELDENGGTRESDALGLKPNFHQYATGQPSYFDLEFDGIDDDDDDWTNDGLRWMMYQPKNVTAVQNELLKSRELDMRTIATTLAGSFCPAASPITGLDPGGSGAMITCEYGRYTCSGGSLNCGPAELIACDECRDLDGDGYERYDPALCPGGTDCNDEAFEINPDAGETCNGIDDNCDGLVDVEIAPACPGGEAECGPQECNYANTCICPDGPENPLDPPSEPCYCGAQQEFGDSPAEPTEPGGDELFVDRGAACASAGAMPLERDMPWLLLVGALAWARRRRRSRS